jgi:hypothetical protein
MGRKSLLTLLALVLTFVSCAGTGPRPGPPGGKYPPFAIADTTGLQSALDGKAAAITGAATTIDTENLTVSRALVSDGSGKVAVSGTVSDTELGYLDGLTSSAQTQITARLPLAGGTMTGALTLSGDPAGALEPVTLQYLQAQLQGLNPKAVVSTATSSNITLSGEQTVNGILTSSSPVLVKSQDTASQNGIYTSNAGAWTRRSDLDLWAEVPGAYVLVVSGTLGETGWVCTSAAGGTIGSTSMAWAQFSAVPNYTADGSGLELSGTQFALELDGTTLTKGASGLKVSTVTATELDYLAGVSSDVQTQLSARATLTGAETLTNKRIDPRVGTTADSAAPTPSADSHDIYTVTALAQAAVFGAPTGTPVNGQKLLIRIKDNGTARALSFNAIYRASSDLALPTTTVLSKTLYLGFIYNSADSKWDFVSKLDNF